MSRTRLAVRLVTEALRGCALPSATMDAWRAVPGGREPEDTSGSCRHIGRWHDPGVTAALYTARLRQTAIAEVASRLEPGRHELTLVQLIVEIPALLDLTDPSIEARLPFPLQRCLANTDMSRARGAIVGDAAILLGGTALFAPCRCGPGGCLCLYAICPNTIRRVSTQHITIIVREDGGWAIDGTV